MLQCVCHINVTGMQCRRVHLASMIGRQCPDNAIDMQYRFTPFCDMHAVLVHTMLQCVCHINVTGMQCRRVHPASMIGRQCPDNAIDMQYRFTPFCDMHTTRSECRWLKQLEDQRR